MNKSPILPTDDSARQLAKDLLTQARFAALGVIHPDTQTPFVTRIAFAMDPQGAPFTLISSLAFHTTALRANPACSLLIGEPPQKGDPLAFPRLTLNAKAHFIPEAQKSSLREQYLASQPKAALYFDFTDFQFVRFRPQSALLNGGFGKAYNLMPEDFS